MQIEVLCDIILHVKLYQNLWIAGMVFHFYNNLPEQKNRVFQQQCRHCWKIPECKRSPVVDLSCAGQSLCCLTSPCPQLCLQMQRGELGHPKDCSFYGNGCEAGRTVAVALGLWFPTLDLGEQSWCQRGQHSVELTPVDARGCRSVLPAPQPQGSHDLPNPAVGIWHGSWRL